MFGKAIDVNGNFQRSEASKGEVATQYFRDLFTSTNPDSFHDMFQGFQAKVTHQMNENLVRHVSKEEITEAVFSIKPSRSPSSDGMTGLFYQKYWDIIGEQVVQDGCLRNGITLSCVSYQKL